MTLQEINEAVAAALATGKQLATDLQAARTALAAYNADPKNKVVNAGPLFVAAGCLGDSAAHLNSAIEQLAKHQRENAAPAPAQS